MDERDKSSSDPFGRVNYRRFVAWSERIQREAALLGTVLQKSPSNQVIDLGCGSGEHCRFLTSQGCQVVGIDRSEGMIQQAMADPLPEGLRFVLGDIRELPMIVPSGFGMAIALGNTLTALVDDEDLQKFLSALGAVTIQGALFLLQILNYHRIFSKGIRHLPLNFVDDDDGSTSIFLRLMRRLPEGRVEFCPSTLKYDPASESALKVVQSPVITLRAWQEQELRLHLEASGFVIEELFGDMSGRPFEPEESGDLVVIARRRKG